MSRKYKIQDQDKLYFVTFTDVQWLDPPVVYINSTEAHQQMKWKDSPKCDKLHQLR